MIAMTSLTCALALQTEIARFQPIDGKRGDSLLLLVLGVGLLLLSVLVRGMTKLAHPDNHSDAKNCTEDESRIDVADMVTPIPERETTPSAGKSGTFPLLSVDVEDYFQTEAFSNVVPRKNWGHYPLRVVDNTKRLLDLFDAFEAKATFFVLGWVADRAPSLVQEIAARGHEVACHSYWHRTVYSLSPEGFRADTRAAISAIENAAGTKVSGYRAPTWSITRKSLWAVKILAEEGFEYDSSIYPIHHDLYGIPGAMASPYVWKTGASRDLVEIPPSTFSIGGLTLPAAGGGYLRIFPLHYSKMAINQLIRRGGLPVVYLHPWEMDRDQPRLQGALKSRLRQYSGLNSFEGKLSQLLATYKFVPFEKRWQDIAAAAPASPFSVVRTELAAS